MKRKMLFVVLIAVAGFAGCNKSDNPGRPDNSCPDGSRCGIAPGGCYPPADCQGVFCTADFREVSLELNHGLATVIRVDSFVVTDATGIPLPAGSGGSAVYGYPNNGPGRFTVINDSWVHGRQNTSMPVRAKGYLNGAEVFNEPYTIAADCCHVSKLSGKDVITIQ